MSTISVHQSSEHADMSISLLRAKRVCLVLCVQPMFRHESMLVPACVCVYVCATTRCRRVGAVRFVDGMRHVSNEAMSGVGSQGGSRWCPCGFRFCSIARRMALR